MNAEHYAKIFGKAFSTNIVLDCLEFQTNKIEYALWCPLLKTYSDLTLRVIKEKDSLHLDTCD